MEVKKCLNCGKEVEQVEGKRERLYCNPSCKASYFRKNKPKEKKYIQIKTFEKLLKENKALKEELSIQRINPKSDEQSAKEYNDTHTDSQMQVEDVPINELKDYVGISEESIEDLAENHKKSIEAQIKALEEELSHVGVGNVGKIRKKFLQSKINNLKSQL